MDRVYKSILLLLLLTPAITHAQYENIWAFGTRAGIDFNTGSPVAVVDSIRTAEGCASVCNAGGELLFYTEGSLVWNRNHQLMPNGTDLVYLPLSYPNTTPTNSTTQGAQIVPVPGEPHKYYIFSLTSMEYGNYTGRLYYSVIDMNMNGGLGDVIPGQKGILIDSMLTEKMTAVPGDRCNVWLLAMAQNAQIKAYNISESGISAIAPVLSSASQPINSLNYAGVMAVSPNRKKIAIGKISIQNGGLLLFDFDPVSGLLSNEVLLAPSPLGVYGLCFSPDNSKLFGSSNIGQSASLFQYDLSSGNPATIAASLALYPFTTFTQLKSGPDDKVYFIKDGATIGRFAHPNLPGAAAQFEPDVVTLLASTFARGGFPNPIPVIRKDTVYNSMDATMLCFSEATTLRANDTTGWDYEWSNGATGASLIISLPGTYWLSYHTAPCTWHVDTFYLRPQHITPELQAMAGCYGEKNAVIRAIPGDTTTFTYLWQNESGDTLRGPLQTSLGDTLSSLTNGANYTLSITTHSGCDTLLRITIPLPDYHASFSASDSIICMGDTVYFTNTSTGSFNTWQWTFGDGSNTATESPQHTFPNPGQYMVRLIGTTAYLCYDTVYKLIVADTILNGAFITDRDSICTGESISFLPDVDSSVVSLHWQFGDGSSFTNNNEPIRHAYDDAGGMVVQLESRYRACPDTSYTDSIYVYPMPLVNLGPDQRLCLQGAPIFLENLQAPPHGFYRSIWSTGDTTARIKIVHPGTYSLTIKAGPLGCSTTEILTVDKDCYIDIPNAFTPDGDGINDYFFPRQFLSQGVTGFSMQVFNRWGQIVFETTQTDGRGWDGRFNGEAQPQGVYIYRINVVLKNARVENYDGNVTLLR